MKIELKSWADGRKTYLVCALGAAIGIAQYFGWQPPHWADWLLAAAGGATLRAAVAKQTLKSAIDIGELVKLVLAQVEVPDDNKDVTGATARVQTVEVHELPPVTQPQTDLRKKLGKWPLA